MFLFPRSNFPLLNASLARTARVLARPETRAWRSGFVDNSTVFPVERRCGSRLFQRKVWSGQAQNNLQCSALRRGRSVSQRNADLDLRTRLARWLEHPV